MRIDDHAQRARFEALVDEQAREHRGEPHDRSDREVDATGDDHEGHADGEDRVDGRLLGQDLEVADLEERG